MNEERLRPIEELYRAAREDRAALDQADPELRREVELLLEQETGKSSPTLPAPCQVLSHVASLLPSGLIAGVPVRAAVGREVIWLTVDRRIASLSI